MRLREVAAMLVGAVVLVVPATAVGATLVGDFSSGNVQGVNSDQSATNTLGGSTLSSPGVKFTEGNAKPTLNQDSVNTAGHVGVIGGGGGTLIGGGSQENRQGINSEQVAKKGKQVSLNVESGTQLIGLAAGDAIIGSPAQASGQGVDSSQLAGSPPGSGTTVVLGTQKSPLTETSTNVLASCQVVLGGPAGTC